MVGRCRPLLLASFNPQEGELRARMLDRFACQLSADDAFEGLQSRLRGVHVATLFQVCYTFVTQARR